MARAIGQATGKWFGSPATGQGVVSFTAITSVGNIAGVTGSAVMMKDGMIADTMIAATTANNLAIAHSYEMPAFGPAFCFRVRD
jgi:hypothetical protein